MILKYKVTKEEFNKLSQLDRIEYRQRIKILEEERPNFNPLGLINQFAILLGFILLVSLGMFNINQEATITIINLIPLIFELFIMLFMTLFIFEVLSILIYRKKVKALNSEYFKLNLKVKK